MLHGKTILEHTVAKLLSHPAISEVVIAVSAEDEYFSETTIANHPLVTRVAGGKERCDSVLNALDYLKQQGYQDWVLVHDAARPNVSHEDISALIEQGGKHQVGAILAAKVRDTMKRSSQTKEIESTVDRIDLWHALTPQMFRCCSLQQALQSALNNHSQVTDEASCMELIGLSPLLVEGRADNLKITQPEDLALAEFYLRPTTQE
ncbi:2-C-methyl-D-erythritol 4-phosphate cytidylyltransferase [Vibrio inusitatus NBRC 102082]|uniref:2-C-methyl-D-erythritol 4-phosphate cytidylyltransferase n=2 Tax=Vibrio inusitatus TaxID=413402 RepID=A0A4Y3HZ38_9VIBR|nr:2-C-methyl-D-erythritol 4-phosphate cytidylyltransferase [Vibrio inusitatus NBRC 102082]